MRHRKKIGPSKRVAKEVLDGILGNVARRQHLGIVVESGVAFAEFADKAWWDRVKITLKPRTAERWRGIVDNHLKPFFKGSLRAITSANIEGYMAQRLEAGANPQTANRELGVLKHMLRRAALWEYLGDNPAAAVKALKEPAGRTRFLTLRNRPPISCLRRIPLALPETLCLSRSQLRHASW